MYNVKLKGADLHPPPKLSVGYPHVVGGASVPASTFIFSETVSLITEMTSWSK